MAAADGEGRAEETASERRTPSKLPWYRRGAVWFWFVVATVLGAWGVSELAEDRLYRFDLDPASAEAEAWCETVEPLGSGVGFWGGLGYNGGLHQQRMAALEAASAAVPAEVADDLEEVTAAERERQVLAEELVARQAAGDEISGDDLEDLGDEHRVALRRLEALTEQACPPAP